MSLKVKLSIQERTNYEKILAFANPQIPDRVTGPEAVTFFKRSGLPLDRLKDIWRMSARTANDFITKEEFFVSLRLIAYAQNNMRCEEESILIDLEVGLPRFEGMPSLEPQQFNRASS